MIKNKKFLILFLLLVVGLSISVVSANQHDTNILDKNILKDNNNMVLKSAGLNTENGGLENLVYIYFKDDKGDPIGLWHTVKIYDSNTHELLDETGTNIWGCAFYMTYTSRFIYAEIYTGDNYIGTTEDFFVTPGIDRVFIHIHIPNKIIESNNMTKYYGDSDKFTVKVIDGHSADPVKDASVSFKVDGKTYNAFTNSDGYASIPTNLNPGEHNITTTCDDSCVNNKITVLGSTIESSDMSKYERGPENFTVQILDDYGNPEPNVNVKFNINGGDYSSLTDNNGYATLKIPDLKAGEYRITTTAHNAIKKTNKITILSIIESSDLIKEEGEGGNFTVRVLDSYGHPAPNADVKFKINGETYKTISNLEGYATLELPDLKAGEYTITTSYNGISVFNKICIVVKTIIENNTIKEPTITLST